MRTRPGTSSVFDGDFPQRFVQFVVDQQDVFRLDAIFTRLRKTPKKQILHTQTCPTMTVFFLQLIQSDFRSSLILKCKQKKTDTHIFLNIT